jgi:hypothetical protein
MELDAESPRTDIPLRFDRRGWGARERAGQVPATKPPSEKTPPPGRDRNPGQYTGHGAGRLVPAEVETSLIAGPHHGDLILGEDNCSAARALVEASTRYTMLCRLEQKDTARVRQAFNRRLAGIHSQLRFSLTYEGKELTQQTLITDLGLKVFLVIYTAPQNGGPAKAKWVAFATTHPETATFP